MLDGNGLTRVMRPDVLIVSLAVPEGQMCSSSPSLCQKARCAHRLPRCARRPDVLIVSLAVPEEVPLGLFVLLQHSNLFVLRILSIFSDSPFLIHVKDPPPPPLSLSLCESFLFVFIILSPFFTYSVV